MEDLKSTVDQETIVPMDNTTVEKAKPFSNIVSVKIVPMPMEDIIKSTVDQEEAIVPMDATVEEAKPFSNIVSVVNPTLRVYNTTLTLGQSFNSYEAFMKIVKDREALYNEKWTIGKGSHSVMSSNARMKGSYRYPEELVYTLLHLRCIHQGTFKPRGSIKKSKSLRTGCPVAIKLRADKIFGTLQIIHVELEHNHPLPSKADAVYARDRRLNHEELRDVERLLKLGSPVKKIQRYVSNTYGKQLRTKDLHNVRQRFKKKLRELGEPLTRQQQLTENDEDFSFLEHSNSKTSTDDFTAHYHDFIPTNSLTERELDAKDLQHKAFGRELRVSEFLLKPDVSFFNHGSYGAVPRRVLELQEKYNREREEHPDFWFRLNAKVYVDKSRQALAQFIGAGVEDVQLVANATTGINTVVRSFPFSAGEGLLYCSFTYGAITNLCEDFVDRIRPDVVGVKCMLPFPPPSEQAILDVYIQALDQNPYIKLAIIDHITSPSSVVMPVKELIELCHSRGVKVIIDGAHSVGQLPLNMKELGADVFVSNCHKWLYSPRGCAFLYLNKEARAWAAPPNTSWQINNNLDLQFYAQGTRDHVPQICARHGLEFYQALGGMERVVEYTKGLADAVVDRLERHLGLKRAALPSSMVAPNIRMVELPPLPDYRTPGDLWGVHRAMFGSSTVFGLVVAVDDKFYLRVSTQVYLGEKDIEKLVDVMDIFLETAAPGREVSKTFKKV